MRARWRTVTEWEEPMASETHRFSSSAPSAQTHSGLSSVNGQTPRVSSSVRKRKTHSGLSSVDPRIQALEAQRAELELTHEELARRAGMHWKTWLHLRQGKYKPRQSTVRRLKAVLEDQRVRMQFAPVMVRASMLVLCIELREEKPSEILEQDFTAERPSNALWLRAATLRGFAMGMVLERIGLSYAAIGRACDCSRQAVQQAIERSEQTMQDDRVLEAHVRRAALLLYRGA